jgi:hypothetical protein
MSQVRTAILETGPSQWLSELLTTDGIRIYTLMPCMLQVCDGACWMQSTPTNSLGEEMNRAGWFDG